MLIGEVVRRSGLSKDGVRYYESLGLIHSSPKQAGSRVYRDYDDTTLERLSLIALAKKFQTKLTELPEVLDRLLSDTISREERTVRLKEKLAEIDAKIEELIEARNLLAEIAENPDKPLVDKHLKRMGLFIE